MSLEIALIGALLIGIELFRSLPAWRRVRRTKSSGGVSPESIAFLASSGIGSMYLAFLVSAWGVLAATALWYVFHLFLVREVWIHSPEKRRRLVVSFFTAALFFLLLTLVLQTFMRLPDALGIMLGIATLMFSAPAMFEGLTSATTRGLSITSLGVNFLEGAIYLLVGFGIFEATQSTDFVLGYVFYGIISLVNNLSRLTRVSWRRARGID